MKLLAKALVCAMALIAAPSLVSAQTGFTVVDYNGTQAQRLFRFDVNSGEAEDLGQIRTQTEQEGLFSVGSVLYGYSEYDPALGNDSPAGFTPDPDGRRDPSTRILPFLGATRAPILNQGDSTVSGNNGNENRRVCAFPELVRFGTESGAAFNPVDGYVYVVNSNDRTADGVVGSRFFRFKPNCLGFEQVGSQTSISVDGLAVDANGNIYASDLRNSDRLYRLINNVLTPLPGDADGFGLGNTALDSGLAFDFENNRLILLAENGTLYDVDLATGNAINPRFVVFAGTTNRVPGDQEGFDIPQLDPIPPGYTPVFP